MIVSFGGELNEPKGYRRAAGSQWTGRYECPEIFNGHDPPLCG
jgi:hypothetical protein